MSVTSLADKCLDEMCKSIQCGNLHLFHRKLTTEESEEVFKRMEQSTGLAEIHKIANFMNMTSVAVDIAKLDDLANLLITQPLSSIELKPSDEKKIFRLTEARPGNKLDIVKTLKKVLGPNSMRTLHRLSVVYLDSLFKSNSIVQLARLVPALKSLALDGTALKNLHLKHICVNFPHLESLSIADTKVDNLEGVGKLEQLTSFCIAGLKFNTPNDILDVFTLNNLICLNASHDNTNVDSNTFDMLAQCKKTFPNLGFIDISGNTVTQEIMHDFIGRHHTIRTVSVINTKFNQEEFTTSSKQSLRFLANDTLKNCINALNYYKNTSNKYIIKFLLWAIDDILDEKFYEQNNKDLNQCFHSIMNFLEGNRFGSVISHDVCFVVTQYTLHTLHQLPLQLRCAFVEAFTSFWMKTKHAQIPEGKSDLRYILSTVFEFLEDDKNMENVRIEVELICDAACKFILCSEIEREMSFLPCCSVLNKYVKWLKADKWKQTLASIGRNLLGVIRKHVNLVDTEDIVMILSLLEQIIVKCTILINFNRNLLSSLLSLSMLHYNNAPLVTGSMKLIELIWNKTSKRARKLMYDSLHMDLFVSDWHKNGRKEQQMASISLLRAIRPPKEGTPASFEEEIVRCVNQYKRRITSGLMIFKRIKRDTVCPNIRKWCKSMVNVIKNT